MEWRTKIVAILALPVLIAMIAAKIWEDFFQSAGKDTYLVSSNPCNIKPSFCSAPTHLEVLSEELSLLENGTLVESSLQMPILLWWTPYSVEEDR